MKIIVIAFEYMAGRHTSDNIKNQYDLIVDRYNVIFFCIYFRYIFQLIICITQLSSKIFKIVADQAANMKKALQDVKESTCIVGDDNIENLTQLLLERSRKYDLINNAKQQKEVEEINKSIDEFNSTKPSNQPKTSSFMKKDQVLLDLDELTEELTIEDDEGENNTDEDVDDDFGTEMINLPVNIADLRLVFSSYLP